MVEGWWRNGVGMVEGRRREGWFENELKKKER